ncbi:MAG: M13-type metalloendopeptidase, partial [Eubacterium sp.]|nr:M13-type metalloendopeptidase [Eubacterium sp.]
SKKGKVTACRGGDAKVFVNVKYKYKKKTTTKKLTLKVKVNCSYKNVVKAIKLKRKTYATFVGNGEGICPVITSKVKLPTYFDSADVFTVSVKDKKIASVGRGGLVIGKKAGTTTVTVKTTDGSNLTQKATIKVYKTRSDIPAADDLTDASRTEYFSTWTDEQKAKFTDKKGNLIWGKSSEADVIYEENMEALKKELKDLAAKDTKETKDGTSEDAMVALYSTAKAMRDGSGDDVFIQTIKNKLIDPILAAKTNAELLKVIAKNEGNGVSALYDINAYETQKQNYELSEALDSGSRDVPEGQTDIQDRYLPIVSSMIEYDEAFKEQKKKDELKSYIESIFNLVGIEPGTITEGAYQIFSDLACTEEELGYNWQTIDQFDKEHPNLAVKKCFDTVGYVVNGETELSVIGANSLKKLNDYFGSEDNLDSLKGATIYNVLDLLLQYTVQGQELRLSFDEPELAKDAAGLKEKAKEEAGYLLEDERIELMANYDLDHAYSNKYYSQELKKEFDSMVEEYRKAYRESILERNWSEKTKNNMLAKIDGMKANSPVLSDEEYRNLCISDDLVTAAEGGNFADNLLKLLKLETDHLKLTVGRRDAEFTWWRPYKFGRLSPTTPWMNNASYDANINQIYFGHVGICNIFDLNPDNDPYIDATNLGYMSRTIGHEMGHAFDDLGSYFNASGLVEKMWTDEEETAYMEKVHKLADYYSVLMAHAVNNKACYQKGMFVVSEAMADLSGAEISYRILKEKYGNRDDFAQIEKIFYRTIAIECMNTLQDQGVMPKDGIEGWENRLLYDVHPIRKNRINGVASMMDAFYQAYDVKKTDAMYVDPADRVTLWG